MELYYIAIKSMIVSSYFWTIPKWLLANYRQPAAITWDAAIESYMIDRRKVGVGDSQISNAGRRQSDLPITLPGPPLAPRHGPGLRAFLQPCRLPQVQRLIVVFPAIPAPFSNGSSRRGAFKKIQPSASSGAESNGGYP
jgi:hypothetical protein